MAKHGISSIIHESKFQKKVSRLTRLLGEVVGSQALLYIARTHRSENGPINKEINKYHFDYNVT